MKTCRVLLEVADRAAGHREGHQAVIVDDEADAALDAADQRLAAGGGAARIGIAHAGDVDVERGRPRRCGRRCRRNWPGRRRRPRRPCCRAPSPSMSMSVDDDVGAVLDGEDAHGSRGRWTSAPVSTQVGRRLDRHLRAVGRHDREIVEAVDDDLLDIGAGGDEDGVAVDRPRRPRPGWWRSRPRQLSELSWNFNPRAAYMPGPWG